MLTFTDEDVVFDEVRTTKGLIGRLFIKTRNDDCTGEWSYLFFTRTDLLNMLKLIEEGTN